RRVCLAYVGELKWHPEALRMDVVGVEHGGNEKPTLAHYANVGLFGKWRGWGGWQGPVCYQNGYELARLKALTRASMPPSSILESILAPQNGMSSLSRWMRMKLTASALEPRAMERCE